MLEGKRVGNPEGFQKFENGMDFVLAASYVFKSFSLVLTCCESSYNASPTFFASNLF